MPKITVDIPTSVKGCLDQAVAQSDEDQSSVVTAALSRYLGISIHTLFQVSTSGALVSGVYSGAVSVKTILEHGDFGLGTFASLDGRACLPGSGQRARFAGVAGGGAPFAVVTRLSPLADVEIGAVANLTDLQKHCDALRTSGNIF